MNCSECRTPIPEGAAWCGGCGAPAPGLVLAGKFKIVETVGRGGMGIVCKAEDLKLHRTVALKFLALDMAGSQELRERFLVEARAAAALSHPNICTLFEIHDQEERPFLEMEYVEGRNLREQIREARLETRRSVEIALGIAEALEEAHRKGIVHRDIKSANIIVTEKGQAKVLDFGLAKMKGESLHTREGTTLGTAAYMSPEQAQGNSVDCRTDIWALGVVLYEMLSGQLPFSAEREAAILYAVIHTEPKPLREAKPDIAVELDEIVSRALKKDVEARYGSAAEMGRDLKAYLEGERSQSAGVLNAGLLLRQLRRPRFALPLAAGLILAAGTVYWVVDRQAKIRQVRQEVLPEIARQIEANDVWRDLTGPYRLAVDAEKLIPGDPVLAGLFSKCSLNVNIRTQPAGAAVYVKEYQAPESEWQYLGLSPIEKIRLPIGIVRWKLEKEGYEPVLAASSTWDLVVGDSGGRIVPYDLVRTLDKKENMPPGMVRVEPAKTPESTLPGFYFDRYEVTNKQYKEFIDKGGYQNRQYWKHGFVEDGRRLAWEQAMARFVDQTGRPGPATWQAGDYPAGQQDYPVSGISWYEAAAYAESAGKSLPTVTHWAAARGEGTPMILWPQLGGFAIFAAFSNFAGAGPLPVGKLPGMTPFGAFDMGGNVREWCWNETTKGRAIRGGGWDDSTYMFTDLAQAPPMDRSAKNGLRCALYPKEAEIPEVVFEAVSPQQPRDYYQEKPVPEAVFQVYKEQFAYDKAALNARVEAKQDRPGGWIHERVTIDAAYGGERIILHLFLPKNAAPPYQTVIYFPGSASLWEASSQDIENYYEFPMFLSFLVKGGRAVLYPVYIGTFERREAATAMIHAGANSRLFTEYLVRVVKDFRRSVDYLETRQDIDTKKLAYYGMSWGGGLSAIIPAVEERVKATVALSGGLLIRSRPEADPINYAGRVKTPVLMLNGKYDTVIPRETAQKPMFDLLGAADKQWKEYETDHIPPRNEFVREILAWLDQKLGPVR